MITTVEQPSPTVAVVALDGELDASNYADLIATGQRLYDAGSRVLVVDLTALTYMSSSGIVALHSLTRVFAGRPAPDPEAGWQAIHDLNADVERGEAVDRVRLVGPGAAVDRTLEKTGLKRLVPVYDTRAAAIAAATGG
jgi:anti-anti-sigma regulatory factor